ncbi:MAG: nitrous oxide reductase accessory protein NosL [Campylobacterota bacterium]|nr:nitrous oxide reductase accessory protein NosL [Campylobacterota bacterium]
MKTVAFLVILLALPLFAEEMSLAKIVKLSNKGEKIVKTLCESDKLPDATGTIEQLMEKIKESHACPPLSKSKLEAVAYYVSNGSMELTGKNIAVPAKEKCPVCGMFVAKYPKWVGLIVVGDKKYYFDGVKDMMKFYIFDGDFPYDRSKISTMKVTDFYTLEGILAKEAFYVIGSDVYGPMGNELIPFKTHEAAKNFMSDHRGREIVLFDKITPKMVMALDGVEYE